MRSLGIDIGRTSIKVVELTSTHRNYQFSGAKIYPLNPAQDEDEISILTTLKRISKDFQCESARVSISLPQNQVSLRRVFFPFKERQKIVKSLAFEIEDDLPYPVTKCSSDARIIAAHDNASEVIAMACLNETLETRLSLCQRASIDPDIVTAEYTAYANLFNPKWYQSPFEQTNSESNTQTFQLVVHMGHTRTFAGLLRGNDLLWGRSLKWGGLNIANALAQTFQVPLNEAIKMLPEKAFIIINSEGVSLEEKTLSKTVCEALEPLIQDLRITVMNLVSQFECQIDSILLFGGPSDVDNIAPYFSQTLELPTRQFNSFEKYDTEKVKSLIPHKNTCLIAFGLAIEGLKRPVNPPSNFRQGLFAKKNLSWEKTWEKWGYTLQLTAVAWVCFLILSMVREEIAFNLEEKSYEFMESQAKTVAGIRKNITHSAINKYIKKQKKNAELVKLYDQVREINSPLEILKNLSSLLPPNNESPNYDVRFFQIKNKKLILQGVAENGLVVKKIENALKSMATNNKVTTSPSKIKKESGKKLFSYEISINRKN